MMNDRRLWTSQEDAIISELVQQHGCRKWTTIASEMAKKIGHQARTSKQIRERWYNHLDPQINKSEWTPQEERIIFEAHRIHGSKWKQIAKLLHARTDNSVKNHFYSTLRRSLRRINKYLGFKNSTNQMRVIKPSILSQLVESAETKTEARMLVDRIFQFSTFKPSKCNATDKVESLEGKDKGKYLSAIQKLVEYNSNVYQTNKKQMRRKSVPRVNKSSSRNGYRKGSPATTEAQLPEVKIEDISQENELRITQAMDCQQQRQNLSTVSDKDNSSWSRSMNQENRMLPQLQHPEQEFDFFGAAVSSQMNPFNLMIAGSQISTMTQLQGYSGLEQKKNICWFQLNQEIDHRAIHLIPNFMFNQPPCPFQDN